MVAELRIDERLAHGQVCVSWTHFLGATHLIIANDKVANDPRQKNIMKMGIPENVKNMFCTIDRAIELINNPKSDKLKIFVVVNCPEDAQKVVLNTDHQIKDVNLANFGSLYKLEGEVKMAVSHVAKLDEKNWGYMKRIKAEVKNLYSVDIVGKERKTISL